MLKLRFTRTWLAVGILIAAFVLVTGLVPPRRLPALGLSDKVEHALAYLGLALWFVGIVARSRYLVLAGALFLFGVAIEILQHLTGWGRRADPYDVLANSVGIVLGLVIGRLGLGGWAEWLERRLGLAP
ncbi:MAG: VanZ family protein [Steroidobacteraceae bacterium]